MSKTKDSTEFLLKTQKLSSKERVKAAVEESTLLIYRCDKDLSYCELVFEFEDLSELTITKRNDMYSFGAE